MGFPAERIVRTDEEDVITRLAEHFGVTRDELIHVIKMAVGARRNTTADNLRTAPGWYSHDAGTQGLRLIFRAKGWDALYENGVEGVFNPKTGMKIIFQNVYRAADVKNDPRAISEKGTASIDLIAGAQPDLFIKKPATSLSTENRGEAWYLCVSCDEHIGVCAELSRPLRLLNKQFADFHERIFIVKKGELENVSLDNDLDMPQQDYDIQISRK
ncbi:hypothetical protein HKD24_05645 [Gluconobacter sp. LMG 31484]|uniref:Uncharacterized protein n=1 Tax=Gluconobacter vitians TaxID=2728102 RepID=A0ABR9Y4C1_9PROT|nr:hypothetical protein [Gluconobacter vitians]MBF0858697.1 hypothetical protein [Gluconobacter vitians]